MMQEAPWTEAAAEMTAAGTDITTRQGHRQAACTAERTVAETVYLAEKPVAEAACSAEKPVVEAAYTAEKYVADAL